MQPAKRPPAQGDRPPAPSSQPHHRPRFLQRTGTTESFSERSSGGINNTAGGYGSMSANPRGPRMASRPPPYQQAAAGGGRSRSGTATSMGSFSTATAGFGGGGGGGSSSYKNSHRSGAEDHEDDTVDGGDDPELRPLLARRTFSHEPEPDPLYSCTTNPHTHLPIYTNIHRIRRDIVSVVEDYLSPEQLHDMRINLSVVRPLVDKLYELDDISIVYCLLVNRARFLHDQAHLSNRQNVNFTRATLCELIAHRVLRRFSEDNEGLAGLLVLSHILVAGFEPFQNAPSGVRPSIYDEDDADDGGSNRNASAAPVAPVVPSDTGTTWLFRKTLPALEVAILTEAKFFLSSTACQKVIEAIYVGRVTYTPSSLLDIIPDRYKQKPIALYDPRRASLLNQYRLIVPRTRNILEACQFVMLLALYVLFMAERDASRFSTLELCFSVFSFGWALDQFATILEHGWKVYTQNLWSFLDATYILVYVAYLVLRLYGWYTGNPPGGAGQQALDVMALAAPVLIPRIAFTLLSDNLLFVSLRSMMADFTLLSFLAAWCFAGFLLSLSWLGEGKFDVFTISKWMVYIWFGLDGTGIQRSTEFHWLLGPSVFVAFAFLGNTLFLTVLVSMLSNTFSTIVSNATAEIQFRRAVLTLEGVKSDAIFAYQPPFNILALFILVPLKFFVSPRWFHKIHVTCVRSINLPVLLVIAFVERRTLWPSSQYSQHYSAYASSSAAIPDGGSDGDGAIGEIATAGALNADDEANVPPGGGPGYTPAAAAASRHHQRRRRRRHFWDRWRMTAHSDIQAVFEVPPPDSVEEEIAADDDLTRHLIRRQFTRQQTSDGIPTLPHAAHKAADKPDNGQAETGGDGNGAVDRAVSAVTGAGAGAGARTAGTIKKNTSTVKFSDDYGNSSQQGTHTPRLHAKSMSSRRDSVAFPGLDPDKLRRLLQNEAGSESGVDENESAYDGGLGSHGGGGGGPMNADMRLRLDALEASMQRIEAMLGQLLGASARRGEVESADEDAVVSGDDDDDGGNPDVNETAAHAAEDAVLDEDAAEMVEHTGTMADLDTTADDR